MESYRVLVLGDVGTGVGGNSRLASDSDTGRSVNTTSPLQSFIQASDQVILNLQAPLASSEAVAGLSQPNVASDPKKLIGELRKLRVDAVGLANDRALQYGRDGLEAAFQALSEAGIDWFGVGRDIAEARKPYRVALPNSVGGGEIHFHASLQSPTRQDSASKILAEEDLAGCAPLSTSDVSDARDADTPQDAFQVAFPRWGAAHKWRNQTQYRLAHRFLAKDYDLVLGHGGRTLQEVHRKQQRWVVYGLGDAPVDPRGVNNQELENDEVLPFSFWAMLEVRHQETRRWVRLKLYPVHAGDETTNFEPGPVTAEDFTRIINVLASRPVRPWRFTNPARDIGEDTLGRFLALDLGDWQERKRPSRLVAPIGNGDPGEWPLRSPDPLLEAEILNFDRPMSVSMLARSAKAEGASVQWFGRLALLENHGKRIIAHDYRAHESSLGGAIVSDKVLTAELLEDLGVPTPKTVLVESADEAVTVAGTFSGPVVVKPRSGNKSRGVSTGLEGTHEVRHAYCVAREHDDEVIVQEHLEMEEELRVMASPDEVVAVIRRIAPHVVGDGTSTIGELIEDKNLQRKLNPHLRTRPIPVDDLTHRQLQRSGLSLETVPQMGQTVTVRAVAGLSVGADAFQALEVTDSQIKKAASAAVAAIPGLGWGGVDIIIEKNSGKPYVIEINTEAAYGGAVVPTYGQPRDVSAKVWKLRKAAAAPEIEATPKVAETREAAPIIRDPSLAPERLSTRLVHLFPESLARQNYSLTPRNRRVLEVATPEGDKTWVTRHGFTAADRSAVQRVAEDHGLLSHLLSVAGIPQPRSRVLTSSRQLWRFVEGRVSGVTLTPVGTRWAGPATFILTDEEALRMGSLPGKMWTQARSPGQRLRVLATREKAWVIISQNTTRPLDRDYLVAAGKLAVQAVRAVPELRWAAVDLLVRVPRLKAGKAGGLLVEGITLQPTFTSQDHIVAGDFDAFSKSLIGPR